MIDFQHLAHRFDKPGVAAIVLMGSHARGEAGPFSDVDLVRFLGAGAPKPPGDGTYLIEGHLVVVSSASPAEIEEWFARPELAVNWIAGLRIARPLLDPHNVFVAIRHCALTFTWDAAMQEKANAWASREMVGWIEEVHKGLEGLRRHDAGRLLNARFGCSWGLSRVMCVQRGVLLSGDNGFYDEITAAVGHDTEWARLRRVAFGIEGADGATPSLALQVTAGLRLYAETAELLAAALHPEDAPLINQTVELIHNTLGPSTALPTPYSPLQSPHPLPVSTVPPHPP
ncbi:MAG: nucleotidyltransferase domain-containing protein [Ardenticatenaceae bacterium]